MILKGSDLQKWLEAIYRDSQTQPRETIIKDLEELIGWIKEDIELHPEYK